MTFTGAHGDIPLGFAHIAYNWEYADETAREAATGFADEDIGKFARQLDNNSMWMLVDTYPVTVWEPLGNPAAILKDGSVAMEGDLNLGSNKITNLANPSSAQDAVTKTYADGLVANLGKRARVRAATTANITISTALNNGDTLDGVSLVTGDWVLVKNQTAAEENGIYEVGVSPARVSEFDTFNEHPGSLIAVQEGTANADTVWLCTSNVGGVLGTNDIDFSPLGTGSSAVEDLTTTETDTSLVLAPDGAGGVEWVAPSGSSPWTQHINESGASFANFTSGGGTWSSDGTVIKQTDTGNSHRTAYFTTQQPVAPGYILEAEMKIVSAGAGSLRLMGLVVGYSGSPADGGPMVELRNNAGTKTARFQRYGVTELLVLTQAFNEDQFYTWRVVTSGDRLSAYLDGVLVGTAGIAGIAQGDSRKVGLVTYGCEAHFKNIKGWGITLP